MRVSPQSCSRSERGAALIGVLLLLLLVSALASALAVSSQTETLVSRNHQSAAQARAAAEAGLNHAAEVVITWLMAWKDNNYPDAAAAVDDLLVQLHSNPTFLTGIEFGDTEDPTPVNGSTDAEYRVYLMDEDNADLRGADATNLTDDELAWNNEDGNPLSDTNRALVIVAVGYAGRQRRGSNVATVKLEAVIGPYKLPALASGGDLTLDGNAGGISVGGDAIGGVHANGDLVFSGAKPITGTPDELGTATATGDCNDCQDAAENPGGSGGNMPMLPIPTINASDFIDWADYILHDDGIIENAATGLTVANCDPNCHGSGWDFNSGAWRLTDQAGTYVLNPMDPTAGFTFYVEGPVQISDGSEAAPVIATIIATGSITGGANNAIVPSAGNLLFVTDKDLELGPFTAGSLGRQGQVLVREQISISGTINLYGQIVVGSCAAGKHPDCDVVSTAAPHDNTISGNVTITNTMDTSTSLFHMSGWREIR